MRPSDAKLMGEAYSNQAGHDLDKASEVMQPRPLYLCIPAGQGQATSSCSGMASHLSVPVALIWEYVQCHPVHVSKLITVQGGHEEVL